MFCAAIPANRIAPYDLYKKCDASADFSNSDNEICGGMHFRCDRRRLIIRWDKRSFASLLLELCVP